jgi:hypothetical protein
LKQEFNILTGDSIITVESDTWRHEGYEKKIFSGSKKYYVRCNQYRWLLKLAWSKPAVLVAHTEQ